MISVDELFRIQKPESIKSQGPRRRDQRKAERRINGIERDETSEGGLGGHCAVLVRFYFQEQVGQRTEVS
jgi:hypothetical protein